MKLPKKDKQARTSDIRKMLLPEMVPEQLKLLGISEADIGNDNLTKARTHVAPGIESIKLLFRRASAKKESQNDLYAGRSTSKNPTQLDLVLENINIFEQQRAALLKQLPPNESANELTYEIFDRLIETVLQIGYSTGSNDSLALTDRYTNSGYMNLATKPQSGGDAKAKAIDPMKALVRNMAIHIYQHKDLQCASKDMLAEAIHTRLVEFSDSGDNRNIPILKKFTNSSPKHGSIKCWLKPITKPKILSKPPKPSLNRLIDELKTVYKSQVIKKELKT